MCGLHPIRFRSAFLSVLHTVVYLSNRPVRPLGQSESVLFLDRHNMLNRLTPNSPIASPHERLCRYGREAIQRIPSNTSEMGEGRVIHK